MSIVKYFYESIPSELLKLNPNEVALRLNTSRGFTNDIIKKCDKALKDVMDCKYSAVKVGVELKEDNFIDLGFTELQSKDLTKNLKNSTEAYIMAVTLGNGVDRLISTLSATSVSECFITDALASAYADAAADFVEGRIKEIEPCGPRFSPGFGDLPLTIQIPVLDAVNASRLLNITINKKFLMSPSKTITAIIGIRK